jgi:hypothetical protein
MKTVEEPLNTIGTIFIVVGILTGILCILFSILEKELFYLLIGLSALFSGLVSGYLFKGISNIIDLLFSLNSTLKNQSYNLVTQNSLNSKEALVNKKQKESKENSSSSSKKKSFVENLEETPSKYKDPNNNLKKNPAASKDRSWAEISDSMKKE